MMGKRITKSLMVNVLRKNFIFGRKDLNLSRKTIPIRRNWF